MNSLKTSLLLLSALLSGCGFHIAHEPPTDYYYLNPNKDLTTIGKVVLAELSNDSSYPQISTDVTEALFQALQKEQVFSLFVIRQNNPAWQSLQLGLDLGSRPQNSTLDISPTYTLEQLHMIRQTLKCNAVLTGTVTEFKPYPHMIIGLRLTLTDLADGQLLWALEQIWDTTDKTTEDRIKKYYRLPRIFPGSGSLREQLGAVSSLKFIKFVAYEVAQTLQSKR